MRLFLRVLQSLLLLLPAPIAAQPLLPDTVYAWQRTELRSVDIASWDAMEDADGDLLRAYDVADVTEAVYVRGTARVRVRVLSLRGRERAFGLFRAMTPDVGVHGIVGDAFCFAGRETFCAFGPFVVQLTASGRRAPPPDEALLLAAKRSLFRQADCYGTDIPLPAEERILGSERYLAPAAEAWAQFQNTAFVPLRELCRTHAAWVAHYEKPLLGVRRTLISFPFRQSAAAAMFAARLRNRCADRGREFLSACASPAYGMEGAVFHVALARDRVILVISDLRDSGCCAWVESLRNG
ncbi:MAG: hypothetical protein RRA94_01010 [Bacteroidota bacterium]|nr:hypothetical protein [Bacteroidota bacterium]